MTLANMRDLGVRNLLVSCLNHACRHEGGARRIGLSRWDRGALVRASQSSARLKLVDLGLARRQ